MKIVSKPGFSALPRDLHTSIFEHMDAGPYELQSIGRVSKDFRAAARANALWSTFVKPESKGLHPVSKLEYFDAPKLHAGESYADRFLVEVGNEPPAAKWVMRKAYRNLPGWLTHDLVQSPNLTFHAARALIFIGQDGLRTDYKEIFMHRSLMRKLVYRSKAPITYRATDLLRNLFSNDKAIALFCIRKQAGLYANISESLKRDVDLVEAAAKGGYAVDKLPAPFCNDRRLLILQLANNPNLMQFLDDARKQDKELVEAALFSPGQIHIDVLYSLPKSTLEAPWLQGQLKEAFRVQYERQQELRSEAFVEELLATLIDLAES